MSISFMALAWKADMPSGRKLVLLALCDHANAQGECYPSVEAIAHKCSMGQRTVQQHIGDLERAGILVRHFRKGRSTLYRIELRHFCRPPETVRPQDPALQRAASGASPPQLLQDTPAVSPPISISKPSMKSSANHQVERGVPLPPTWTLPKAWEEWALQAQPAWNAAHVHFVAEKFHDYWMAMPGQRGMKADWLAAWRNWCRNEKPTGRTSQAMQGGWRADPAAFDANDQAHAATPLPGESYPTFIARMRRDRGNSGTAATSLARPLAAAHSVASPRSMISLANRAAALDAARALKSRLGRTEDTAHAPIPKSR